MTVSDVPVFTISRTFAAPVDTVYDAWADPRKMVAWSGPKGSTAEIVQGEVAEGHSTITRTSSDSMGDMFTLCKWRELQRPSRVVWEQSFCDEVGNKTAPPFFDDWPLTLLTEVDFAEVPGGTEVTLDWTPIEYTDAALAMFVKQMASMKGGWGGSFDKLEEYLTADG